MGYTAMAVLKRSRVVLTLTIIMFAPTDISALKSGNAGKIKVPPNGDPIFYTTDVTPILGSQFPRTGVASLKLINPNTYEVKTNICSMVNLANDDDEAVCAKDVGRQYEIGYDDTDDRWKCEETFQLCPVRVSHHFGCKTVTIPASGSVYVFKHRFFKFSRQWGPNSATSWYIDALKPAEIERTPDASSQHVSCNEIEGMNQNLIPASESDDINEQLEDLCPGDTTYSECFFNAWGDSDPFADLDVLHKQTWPVGNWITMAYDDQTFDVQFDGLLRGFPTGTIVYFSFPDASGDRVTRTVEIPEGSDCEGADTRFTAEFTIPTSTNKLSYMTYEFPSDSCGELSEGQNMEVEGQVIAADDLASLLRTPQSVSLR